MGSMSVLGQCCVIAGCVAVSTIANAGDRPTSSDALAHLARGGKLYEAGDFEKAIEEFTAGLLIEPAPIFHYDLGQCYWQTGDLKSAEWHYQRFLASHTTADVFSKHAKERIAQAQARQAAASNETSARPTPPTTPPAPPLPVAPTQGATTPSRASRSRDWLALGVLGTGAAASIVGGAFVYTASGIDDDANRTASQQDANALHDKASTRRLLGIATGVGGVALLGIGAFMLVRDSHAQQPTRSALNVVVSPTGVVVFGTF